MAKATQLDLVVTTPDRPSGRGQRLRATPIKSAAEQLGIAVVAPTRLQPTPAEIANLKPDLLLLASYGKILPPALLGLPVLGALNVHPSLLPLYRGATPIQSALRDGRTETGVTIMMMDAGMDTGDIVLQEATAIEPGENYGLLHDRLALHGAELLRSAMERFARGDSTTSRQSGETSITRPLRRGDLTVQWTWTALEINNTIRAFSPKPSARALVAGVPVKLLRAHVAASAAPAETLVGTVLGVEGEAALIACGEGVVALDQLTPPNRAATSGAAFVRSCSGA